VSPANLALGIPMIVVGALVTVFARRIGHWQVASFLDAYRPYLTQWDGNDELRERPRRFIAWQEAWQPWSTRIFGVLVMGLGLWIALGL
jgi:hypothetical protein